MQINKTVKTQRKKLHKETLCANNLFAMNRFLLALWACLYGCILMWYVGRREAVALDELQHVLSALPPGGRITANDLYEFQALDKGQEFYMVNYIKWNTVAKYPAGSPFEHITDPQDANRIYSMFATPELFKRACYPIFIGNSIGKGLIRDSDSAGWDRVVVVRYRSFRDFLHVYAAIVSSGAGTHKFAAIEKTLIMPTQGGFLMQFIIPALFTCFFGVWALVTSFLF